MNDSNVESTFQDSIGRLGSGEWIHPTKKQTFGVTGSHPTAQEPSAYTIDLLGVRLLRPNKSRSSPRPELPHLDGSGGCVNAPKSHLCKLKQRAKPREPDHFAKLKFVNTTLV